ncbi:MAG TPA: hypothetical protein V6D14_30225 [Coleofasciculaceae cyanobacterium]|jgi:hypothetical protein
MAEHIECPECGKKAVVQREDSLYQCLDCDFNRDFSEPPESTPSENPLFWPGVIATIIALLFLQARHAADHKADLQLQSSQAPVTIQSKMD